VDTNTVRYAEPGEQPANRGPGAAREPGTAVVFRPVAPGLRWLLVTASVLVALAGIQLLVFTAHTGQYFAFTITSPLAAVFLGAGYWAAVPIEALAARERQWANARISVPAVVVFTVLTLAVTLTHLGQLHLGARYPVGTQAVAVAWLVIYVGVPALMATLLVRQVRAPGLDPPRTAGLPPWLCAALAAQAAVLLGAGIALFAAPTQAAPLWPWHLTPMLAQAIGAWLIALGVASAHVIVERDPRRLRPAAAGSIVLPVLLAAALARYPHQFHWHSTAAIVYLTVLATMLLTGTAILARGRPRTPRPSAAAPAAGEQARGNQDNSNTNLQADNSRETQAVLAAAPGPSGHRQGWDQAAAL
jgi:hypothetical protein